MSEKTESDSERERVGVNEGVMDDNERGKIRAGNQDKGEKKEERRSNERAVEESRGRSGEERRKWRVCVGGMTLG